MSIGGRRIRERRRRAARVFLGVAKWLAVLAVFVGLGYWSYESGLDLARAEVTELEARLETLGADARALRAANGRLEGELARARQDTATLQRRYDRDVPAGDAAALFRLAQERIAAGLSPDRAAQILRDAAPLRRCEGRGTNRRFAINYGPRMPDDAGISLLEGLVRVAVGVPAPNDDPARAATVVISVAGQDPQSLTGLPQRQALALGNVELTIAVTSDVRGFATVNLSTCGS